VTYEEFDRFCASLPAATYVEQWGGAHVWKVGGKVFAIGGWEDAPAFTFKATKLSFEMMKSAPGLRPAPYLASRGLSWLQRIDNSSLSDEELRGYLRKSHELVSAGLTRAARRELGLDKKSPSVVKAGRP
jgi:predicted DNA-binding protein (MmcQ/YjbR family)